MESARILTSLLESIESSSALDDPFRVLQFDRVFPKNVYRKLLAAYPPEDRFYELPHPDALRADGTSTRQVFDLRANNIKNLAPVLYEVWDVVVQVLNSSEVRNAIFARLAPGIAKRLRISEKDACQLTAFSRCGLTRDASGFRISAHPDWHTKIVTVQFYLTDRWDQQGLGTHFLRDPEMPVFTSAYRPNTGYAFAVDESSWHSRDTLPELTDYRHSLALTYFLEPPVDYQSEEY